MLTVLLGGDKRSGTSTANVPRLIHRNTVFALTMSPSNFEIYDYASKMENVTGGNAVQLERLHIAGGHLNDRTQPSLPVVYRSFADPALLGLLSFATGIGTTYFHVAVN